MRYPRYTLLVDYIVRWAWVVDLNFVRLINTPAVKQAHLDPQ